MTSSRRGAAGSATETPGTDPSLTTESDDPFMGRPGRTAGPGTPNGAREPGANGPAALMGQDGADDGDGAEPLTERDAEAQVHGICFKTGPPARVGVELEWLVCDTRDPTLPVDHHRAATAVAPLSAAGALPGRGMLTTEPGGQLELSSAPAAGLGQCIATAHRDLAALRQAIHQVGLCLSGQGLDPIRPPRRVLELPRYAAMEEFFDRAGPWGRLMMCSTASVQVCVDAGGEGPGWSGFRWRWHLLHAIGPVLVAAFANSPLRGGRPTGWKSTRQAIWARLDPTRTRPPAHAEPLPGCRPGRAWPPATDPRSAWVDYALAAEVMCVRRPGVQDWSAPAGLTFRDWLRGAGERPPTRGDLSYHLSTLFPPVRPRGHLEIRGIDAQPGDGWIVPLAVTAALLDDPLAAEEAMAAAEVLWQGDHFPGWRPGSPWWLAARQGPAHPALAAASRRCFAAAEAALVRAAAPRAIRQAVAAFAERYVNRDRCPADDLLDQAQTGDGHPLLPGPIHTLLEDFDGHNAQV
jgi:glutamate--cysteine ligase